MQKAEFAISIGADHHINYKDENFVDKIMEA